MKRFLIFASAMLLLATACSKTNSWLEGSESFTIGADGWPISNAALTDSQVQTALNGYGWEWYEGKTMKDGKVTDENFYERDGACAVQYYFHEGIATSYWVSSTRPALCSQDQQYSYDAEHNDLLLGKSHTMRIVKIDNTKFSAIDYVGSNSDGMKIFVLSSWRRMTDQELKNYQEKYTSK